VRARLLIEYDGSGFAGWARQPGRRTVQGELEHALAIVLRRPEGVPLTVAGRTDAGVHAWGQVASYEGEPVLVEAINALIGTDVAVLRSEPAPAGFDARRDATSRVYCYRVLARPGRAALARSQVLHWPHGVELAQLQACAQALIGSHDFTAFTPTDTYHVRFEREVLAADWRREGDVLEFWIEADTFMRHMNRVLVGTMLEVATGRRTVAEFGDLLSGGRPRAAAGPTAPAHGLYLAAVGYAGVPAGTVPRRVGG
jgi:tRNA pseudouridine38-40 synthase